MKQFIRNMLDNILLLAQTIFTWVSMGYQIQLIIDKILYMGNEQTTAFEIEPWQVIRRQGNCTYLRNNTTSQIVQKYLDHKEYQNRELEQEIFKWRCELNHKTHIVQVFEYGVRLVGNCSKIDQFYVITQNIQKFNRLPAMSKPEGFLILKHIIEGLIVLKPKFGLFSPTTHHIGVNKYGQAKIWINENFASNQIERDGQAGKFEQTVVNNLCKLIQNKVFSNEPNHINYPYQLNFNRALQHIQHFMSSQKGFRVHKIKTTLTQTQNNQEQEVTKSNNQNTDNSRNTNLNFQARASMKQISPNFSQPLFAIQQRRQGSDYSNYNSGSRVSRNSYYSKQGFTKIGDNGIHKNNYLQTIPQYHPVSFPMQSINAVNLTTLKPAPIPYHPVNISTQYKNQIQNNNVLPVQNYKRQISTSNTIGYEQNKHKPIANPEAIINGQTFKKNTNIQQKKITKNPAASKGLSIHSELRIKENIEQVDSVVWIPEQQD